MAPEIHTDAALHGPDVVPLPERNDLAPDASGEEQRGTGGKFDALLALAGTDKGIWGDEGADAYVRRLREGWE